MKKKIAALFCIISILVLGAVYAHAANEVTVTVKIADGIEIPEAGITVRVCYGNLINSAGGGDAAAYEYPYSGYAGNITKNTSWIYANNLFIRDREEVTFLPAERSKEITLELPVTAPQTERGIGYEIISEGYIGSGGIKNVTGDTAELEVTYIKGVTLSGTITLPEAYSHACGVDVVGDAEGKSGIEYDYTFSTLASSEEGAASLDYSVIVRPDMDYEVYISFEDSYKIQKKDLHIGTADETLDFTAERARKISGTIKLPEDYTDFKTIGGGSVSEIQVEIILQDAGEPHKYISDASVILTPENPSAEFELSNISDAENTIVFYRSIWPFRMQGLCRGGDYYDDTKCVPYVDEANGLALGDHEIVINMMESNQICFDINVTSPSHNVGNVIAIVTDENGNSLFEISAENVNEVYYANIPKGYDSYILAVTPSDDDDIYTYCTEDGFTQNIEDAVIFKVSDGDQSVYWDGYEPLLPLVNSVRYSENTEGKGTYTITTDNLSDSRLDNVRIFVVDYYKNGEFEINIESGKRGATFYPGTNGTMQLTYNKSSLEQIEKIYMFMWDENNRPLSEKIILKEETD